MCCSGKHRPRLLWRTQTEINFPQIDAKITALHHLQHIQNCAVIWAKMCHKHEEDIWKLSQDMMRFQNSKREIQRGKSMSWMDTFKGQKYEEIKVATWIDSWSKTEWNGKAPILREQWITSDVLGVRAKYKKASGVRIRAADDASPLHSGVI